MEESPIIRGIRTGSRAAELLLSSEFTSPHAPPASLSTISEDGSSAAGSSVGASASAGDGSGIAASRPYTLSVVGGRPVAHAAAVAHDAGSEPHHAPLRPHPPPARHIDAGASGAGSSLPPLVTPAAHSTDARVADGSGHVSSSSSAAHGSRASTPPPPPSGAGAGAGASCSTPGGSRVDIRSYVPCSGATGLRYSEAGSGTPGGTCTPGSASARATPQAPIGIPDVVRSPAPNMSAAQMKSRRARILLENLRCEKWQTMLSNWKIWSSTKAEKVKSRCRKGIPDPMRSAAWPKLSNAVGVRDANARLYDKLLALPIIAVEREGGGGGEEDAASAHSTSSRAAPAPTAVVGVGTSATLTAKGESKVDFSSLGGATPEIVDTIERDINRTFPQYSMFSEVGGIGQLSLFRILVAYAQYDRKVGYCQGMGFLAAMFLSYMPEEAAFYMFLSVLQSPKYKLCDLYAPGLPRLGLLQHQLQGLMNQHLPKLAKHLLQQHVHPTMYAAQWLLTIYTYNFPFAIVVRVWDAFLCEGWKVVFRVALAILKLSEGDLLAASSFEAIMLTFRGVAGKLDADRLMETAFAFHLRGKHLTALDDEYMAITTAGYAPCSEAAGHGAAAHVKLAAAQRAAAAAAKKR